MPQGIGYGPEAIAMLRNRMSALRGRGGNPEMMNNPALRARLQQAMGQSQLQLGRDQMRAQMSGQPTQGAVAGLGPVPGSVPGSNQGGTAGAIGPMNTSSLMSRLMQMRGGGGQNPAVQQGVGGGLNPATLANLQQRLAAMRG